jgi:hypothetical protein
MPYDLAVADGIREYLAKIPKLHIEEKEMFRGLTFMVNGKMCISVSGDKLMCRFDPERNEEVAEREGFENMIMKGKVYKGFGYVEPHGFKSKKDFEYWINLCLEYNPKAKSSKKKK